MDLLDQQRAGRSGKTHMELKELAQDRITWKRLSWDYSALAVKTSAMKMAHREKQYSQYPSHY